MLTPPPVEPAARCRACGRDAPADGPQYCSWCFGPVEVLLPTVSDPVALRDLVGAGPPSLLRYDVLLPRGLQLAGRAAGWTPMWRAEALGRDLDLDDLWLKDETANPTGSFKDRVAEVASARARQLDLGVFACTSTGNLARAVAEAATRRGLPSVVLVPEGLPSVEVRDLVARGAFVVAVRGGYDAASRLGAEAAADLDHWGWANVTLRPWYELGARTLGFEIAEQLNWRLPDRVVAPMASGALARAVHDAFSHLLDQGLASGSLPRLTVVQPAGCGGVAEAFAAGADDPVTVLEPQTVAASLAMGDPPDGRAVIDAARATGGVVHAVDEGAIEPAVEQLRRSEGVVGEPSAGVVVAAIGDLRRSGVIDASERVVAVVSGAPPRLWSPSAATRVVPGAGLAGTIDPSLGALIELLPPELRRRP